MIESFVVLKVRFLFQGGEVVFEGDGILLVCDLDGGVFFLIEVKSVVMLSNFKLIKFIFVKFDIKWCIWVGLGSVYFVFFINLNWIWGILFLMWIIFVL